LVKNIFPLNDKKYFSLPGNLIFIIIVYNLLILRYLHIAILKASNDLKSESFEINNAIGKSF